MVKTIARICLTDKVKLILPTNHLSMIGSGIRSGLIAIMDVICLTRVEMTGYREHIENETQSPGQSVLVRRGNHNTFTSCKCAIAYGCLGSRQVEEPLLFTYLFKSYW